MNVELTSVVAIMQRKRTAHCSQHTRGTMNKGRVDWKNISETNENTMHLFLKNFANALIIYEQINLRINAAEKQIFSLIFIEYSTTTLK